MSETNGSWGKWDNPVQMMDWVLARSLQKNHAVKFGRDVQKATSDCKTFRMQMTTYELNTEGIDHPLWLLRLDFHMDPDAAGQSTKINTLYWMFAMMDTQTDSKILGCEPAPEAIRDQMILTE